MEDEPSLTFGEFCRLEGVSKSWLYEQLRLGLGPEITELGPRVRRITPKARAEWHERMAELAKSESRQLEAERRRAQAASAASPRHISRRRRQAT